MNPPDSDNLESRLSALTEPTNDPPRLWQAALAQHRATPRQSLVRRLAPWAAVAALILVSILLFLPVRGVAHKRAPSASSVGPPERMQEYIAHDRVESAAEFGRTQAETTSAGALKRERSAPAAASMRDESDRQAAASPRLIARKADISLKVPDVREAFLKAGRLISPALGEFVGDSKISGEGPAAAADLTLRVAADRLPAVLNDLRALGVVQSENSASDEVTTQAVDLDARLRTERGVEKELLDLLDKRKDAPLAEVLQLRESLKTVRAAVERFDAQRENLQRLVDLATVLVILRPQDAPPPVPPADKGFISHLTEQSTLAWRDGSRCLAESLATLIELGVGRLPAWITLLIVAAVGVRLARRFARWSLLEPAPRL